jgi:predicted peptidase
MKHKKTKILFAVIPAAIVLLLCAVAGYYFYQGGAADLILFFDNPDRTEQMEARALTSSGGVTLPYRIFVPEDDDSAAEYPLVLFLHGSGQCGDDNRAQAITNNVMQTLLKNKNKRTYPCIVVAPQCPEDSSFFPFVEEDSAQAPDYSIPEAVMELLEQVKAEYPVDAGRVYLTGTSMGGYGAWGLLSRYADIFAAAVPICGWADPAWAAAMKDVPIWVFHGARDNRVDPENSREMVRALQEAGSTTVKYTEYKWEKHWSWVRAYHDDDLFAWMFACRKH